MHDKLIIEGIPGYELPLDEVRSRGAEWYRKLKLESEPLNHGRYVAIDVRTGDYEIARSTAVAMRRLQLRRPGAQLFLRKVGSAPEPELASRVFGDGSVPHSAPSQRKL